MLKLFNLQLLSLRLIIQKEAIAFIDLGGIETTNCIQRPHNLLLLVSSLPAKHIIKLK